MKTYIVISWWEGYIERKRVEYDLKLERKEVHALIDQLISQEIDFSVDYVQVNVK